MAFKCLWCRGLLLFALQWGCLNSFSQSNLAGTITDETGTALPNATVILKGTYQGTISDRNGTYRFTNLTNGNYILKVSFVGYQPQEKQVTLADNREVNFELKEAPVISDEVIVAATRAGSKTPVAVTNVSGEELVRQNTGQDIPYQLRLTPSLVESSEAGNGVGYSALRIRGTDATRINVTINGIPLNDSESQGVFWVNMPDFSSSVQNIQIQRGVGTSTNGAAAFGATINFQTETLNKESYAEVQSIAGSFNTFRNTFKAGTGLIDEKFSFDARYSKLKSDGYVDYAFSDHESFFVTGAYYSEKSMIKANVFSGEERTGISWWGNPIYKTNRTYNPAGEHTDEFGNKQYYKDQTDNYKQTHYQLHYSLELNKNLHWNTALHYTKGKGFFEQYKEDQEYSAYGLPNTIIGDEEITTTDIIRRKWLKNDFYGFTFSLNYQKNRANAFIGGAWNRYDGDHFGNIIWARYMGNVEKGFQWYFNNGKKTDYNVFAKVNYELSSKLNVYGDVQYRHIDYRLKGFDDDLSPLVQDHTFNFFNPKAGAFYSINDRQDAWFSVAIAHREPTRANFKDAKGDAAATPKQETLYDFELGYDFHAPRATFGVNFYYMYYRDQLVPTGEKSNVGYDIMTNVDKSYRAGVELVWGVKLLERLKWDANLTLSRNRIKNSTEYAFYYDENWNEEYKGVQLGDTDISYSPEITGSSIVAWSPVTNLDINFISKYVGKQFFDNTSDRDRRIDDYFINDLRINYSLKIRWIKNITMQLQINNLFDVKYENNAYGGNWYEQGVEKTWAYYYPQAGINFLAGITIKF